MNSKRVVNIINFIRAEDPRPGQKELFDTFVNEVELCKSYPMPYTFLMQYDTLVRPEYVKVLKDNTDSNMEIGVWIEMAQEQVEKLGIKWRGRPGYKWDWHVNPDMLMAYTLPQREALIDELMEKFFSTFGYYPRSAGSWLLDSYSVNYMAEKYGIEAFCICRDQFGTDGYTLWGGYYNQGYYPSKKNVFMPAQTKEQQINVPIFRMLGPDPIYQYDMDLDEHCNPVPLQHVYTMEPAWSLGQNPDWVDWYLHTNFESEDMGFSYTQTGQENPFTWKVFGDGLKMQMEKIYNGVKEGRWEVLSMGDTGHWFKNTYETTPATAITALNDWKGEGNQSVWYNCKNYRVNFCRKDGKVGIRDMFVFAETHCERYIDDCVKGDSAIYDTLPVVDGYRWSGNDIHSVLFFEEKNAEIINVKAEPEKSLLNIVIKTKDGLINAVCCEDAIKIMSDNNLPLMSLQYNTTADTEIKSITDDEIRYLHNGVIYGIRISVARFEKRENGFAIVSADKEIHIIPFVV